jgi:hypothetical protein
MRGLLTLLPTVLATPLAAQSASPSDSLAAVRVIAVGQRVQGTLGTHDALSADSTDVQGGSLEGVAGRTVTVDLESDAFDADLMLRGPGITGSRDYSDDDSGGGCDARLTVTFPQTGVYEIIVNTAAKMESGAFTLAVTAGSRPKSLTRCNRDR